jgi:hypothetical protein
MKFGDPEALEQNVEVAEEDGDGWRRYGGDWWPDGEVAVR